MMAKERCAECGQIAEHKLTMVNRRERVLNEMVEAKVPCMICQNCGDGYFLYDEAFERKVTESKRRQQGYLYGAEIRAIREQTGLDVADFIKLMQEHGGDCSVKCYEHFENDTMCQNANNEKAIRDIAKELK